jgi:predicted RNA-binding Zn ribbon-like protein
VWSRHAELLDRDAVESIRALARQRPGTASRALTEARRLRGALYRHLLHADDREAFAVVATVAQRAVQATHLVLRADGLAARVLAEPGLATPLHAVTRAAEQLLTDPARRSVRACPGHDCGWLFLDRAGRRRWCSMGSCGNRAKVRAHAARRKAGGP